MAMTQEKEYLKKLNQNYKGILASYDGLAEMVDES